ncbi:MAG: acylphosphatase, partial [Atopobiaceae bacterium]|nr:acylphosphatase [Atopobiaceae bacterium]
VAGVSGWVKNLDNGTVLCELEGSPQQIEAFFAELNEQSKTAWFRHQLVSSEAIESTGAHGFSIKY